MSTIEQSPKVGPELQRLNVFVGKWQVEGKSYGEGQTKEDPYGSAVKWLSDEDYEWLPGGFFLIHHWNARVGESDFIGTGIMGYDESSGDYYAYSFDNSGYHPTYQVRVDNNTWAFSGEAQRATIEVSNDGNTMTFHWEWKNDGVTWLPLCDRKAVKVG